MSGKLTKQAREAIIATGVDYLAAKADADKYAKIKKDHGERVVEMLKELGKRKVVGRTADGSKLSVGFGNRTTIVFDEASLFDVLREAGVLDRVLKTVVDQDALAAVLADESLGEETIGKIREQLYIRKTPYPMVRRQKQ